MVELSPTSRHDYKSPKHVVIGFLSRSRDLNVQKYRETKLDLDGLNVELQKLRKQLAEKEAECDEWKAKCRDWECKYYSQASQTPITLPPDPPIGAHGFGPRMVGLGLEMSKIVGFRGAEKVMGLVFGWLGCQQTVPDHTSLRIWAQRLGIATMQEPLEKADDWIWIVDHSNQIGQEKILVILAIRASKLPPKGAAIKHEDVHPLIVKPGTSWKREDVAKAYQELEVIHGCPRAILCDGAVELRESADVLKAGRADLIVLQDFKHKAANILESEVGKSERFKEFLSFIGTTRSSIQQTEMAHLTPPPLKTKARFMNLSPLMNWTEMILTLFEHPEAKARECLTSDRLETKLGWIKQFRTELQDWQECQEVINRGLFFINTQGIFPGAADELHQESYQTLQHPTSRKIAERLTEFVRESEKKLKPGERLSLSTEILESAFGLFKQLEGQHSKGGFTGLIAALPALLVKVTPHKIQQAFATVSSADARNWVKQKLGSTVASKRRLAYGEMKKLTRMQTENAKPCATKLTARI